MGCKDEATEAFGLWRSKDGREWLLTFQLVEIAGRLDCVGFAIDSWPTDAAPAPLYAETMHQLRFGTELTRARRETAQRRRDSATGWSTLADRPGSKVRLDALTARVLTSADQCEAARLDTPSVKGGRHAKYTTADLELVATVYRAAWADYSTSPTKDVATALGVSRGQAGKLVMRARRSGLLPPAEGEGIAGWAQPSEEGANR